MNKEQLEIAQIKVKIQKFIKNNSINEYNVLMDILADNFQRHPELYCVASTYPDFFGSYIASYRNGRRN